MFLNTYGKIQYVKKYLALNIFDFDIDHCASTIICETSDLYSIQRIFNSVIGYQPWNAELNDERSYCGSQSISKEYEKLFLFIMLIKGPTPILL